MPSFVVTLAGLFVLRGATLGSTRGDHQLERRSRAFGNWPRVIGWCRSSIRNFSSSLLSGWPEHGWILTYRSGRPEVVGLPVEVLWWLGLTALATWILLRTGFGNWIFATGGAKEAARNLGVPVDRVKIVLFMATSGAAALFAVVQVLDTGSADTLRGLLKEFEAIIAVVVGGTLLAGGYGSAIGGMFGALIFGTVSLGHFLHRRRLGLVQGFCRYRPADRRSFQQFHPPESNAGAPMTVTPLLELVSITKLFESVVALKRRVDEPHGG